MLCKVILFIHINRSVFKSISYLNVNHNKYQFDVFLIISKLKVFKYCLV